LIIACDGDLANAIIPRIATISQPSEIEDLHDVLLVGLDAGKSSPPWPPYLFLSWASPLGLTTLAWTTYSFRL
jgi:hypothetical protein